MTSSFAPRVSLHDLTLRSAAMHARVAVDEDALFAIAEALAQAGVGRIDLGGAIRRKAVVQRFKANHPITQVSALVHTYEAGWQDQAREAVDAGADILTVLVRAGAGQLADAGLTADHALRDTERSVPFVRALGVAVCFEPSFVTAGQPAFVRRLLRLAADAGAHDIHLVDTSGIASPDSMRHLVTLALEATGGLPIGVECRNDFGLALANTLAGLQAGANAAATCILGLGARAGSCPLEQLAITLERLYGVPTGLRLAELTPLAHAYAGALGLACDEQQPVVGKALFRYQSDALLKLVQADPALLEPFPPEVVGQRRTLALGRASGPLTVAAKARELGYHDLAKGDVEQLTAWVSQRALASGSIVGDADFRARLEEITLA